MPPDTPLFRLLLAILLIGLMSLASLFVGVSDISLSTLANADESSRAVLILVVSRIPRTLAILLSGASLAVAGTIMQMLARNRFVEPTTAGTVQSASLGIICVLLLAPGMSIIGKMLVASVFALAGTALFLRILRQVPLRSTLLVPLLGIMLGNVIGAITTFIAYRYDLLQSLSTWMTGDFSSILQGRYELLWLNLLLTVVAYLAADRFTVAGMGEDFTKNLGLNYRRVLSLGLTIVAIVTAVMVTTVGAIPFLGLVVPNIVSMAMGDNIRRSLPWIALLGAGSVLTCDIIGRLIIYPYEIPIGTVFGVLGSIFFLYLLLRRQSRAA